MSFHKGKSKTVERSHQDGSSEVLVAYGYRNTLALKRSGLEGVLVT